MDPEDLGAGVHKKLVYGRKVIWEGGVEFDLLFVLCLEAEFGAASSNDLKVVAKVSGEGA
jgi:hypothetical protein